MSSTDCWCQRPDAGGPHAASACGRPSEVGEALVPGVTRYASLRRSRNGNRVRGRRRLPSNTYRHASTSWALRGIPRSTVISVCALTSASMTGHLGVLAVAVVVSAPSTPGDPPEDRPVRRTHDRPASTPRLASIPRDDHNRREPTDPGLRRLPLRRPRGCDGSTAAPGSSATQAELSGSQSSRGSGVGLRLPRFGLRGRLRDSLRAALRSYCRSRFRRSL